MTEIYRGSWDVQKVKVDEYHPKYPDVNGRMKPDYGQVVAQAVKVEQSVSQVK